MPTCRNIVTVFEAARQVDCIWAAERLGLQSKRSGSRRFARCFFHAENTPPMCFYPNEGGFYCFGCQKHGDMIHLYQQALSISSLDAAKQICSDFGLSYDQRKHKKYAPPPYKLPSRTAQTLAKRLSDGREAQVQCLLHTERAAEMQMERIESGYIASGNDISAALEEPDWEAAFHQKCKAQERNAVLDSLSLPELLLQVKEDMHGETT